MRKEHSKALAGCSHHKYLVRYYSSQTNLYLGSHSTLYRPTAFRHIRQTSKSHTNLQPATNRPTSQCMLFVFCLTQLVSAKNTAVTKATLQDPATVTQIPPTVATLQVSTLVACRISLGLKRGTSMWAVLWKPAWVGLFPVDNLHINVFFWTEYCWRRNYEFTLKLHGSCHRVLGFNLPPENTHTSLNSLHEETSFNTFKKNKIKYIVKERFIYIYGETFSKYKSLPVPFFP